MKLPSFLLKTYK